MRGICEFRNAKNLLLSTADRNVVKDRFLESITFGQQEKKLSSILRQFNEEKITLEKVLARQRWYKKEDSMWKLARAITEGVYWCGSKIELNRIILRWNLCVWFKL